MKKIQEKTKKTETLKPKKQKKNNQTKKRTRQEKKKLKVQEILKEI